jgi:hypothetical protein
MSKKTIRLLPSIILYIIAVLLAAYTLWSYKHCAGIIAQAREYGQLAASGNEYDIASFYMANCGLYAVFALLLAAAGIMLQRNPSPQTVSGNPVQEVKHETNDDELDEWFDELESIDNDK